jgi:predicted secreted protein
MTITAALVLFAVVWWMVFFCVLPMRFKSQAETGNIVRGTPASAPDQAHIVAKAKATTLAALVIFAVLYLIITQGNWTIDDVDVFGLWKNRY